LATHITLVLSGLLFAIMDRIAEGTKEHEILSKAEQS
jgi:hypothetical protein